MATPIEAYNSSVGIIDTPKIALLCVSSTGTRSNSWSLQDNVLTLPYYLTYMIK